MKYLVIAVIGIGVVGYMLFAEEKPRIDLTQVLNRTVVAMDRFDKFLKEKNIDKATTEHMDQLTGFMQKVMNVDPRLHEGLIAMKLEKDAKFAGVNDANSNGTADEGEKQLFTVEIDSENKRLIATDASGDGTSRGISGMGFLAGAMIGALLGRQRAAGVRPGSFNNRRLTTPTAYRQARSRARSGGLFGGK